MFKDSEEEEDLINEELIEGDPNEITTPAEPFTFSKTLFQNDAFFTILEMAGIGDDDEEEENEDKEKELDKKENREVGDTGREAGGIEEAEIEQEMIKLLEQQQQQQSSESTILLDVPDRMESISLHEVLMNDRKDVAEFLI